MGVGTDGGKLEMRMLHRRNWMQEEKVLVVLVVVSNVMVSIY